MDLHSKETRQIPMQAIKREKKEMSNCIGVGSYITGRLQLHRCVTVKWNIKPLGRAGRY